MYGKCRACSSWGTLQEELIPTVSTNTNAIATFSHLTATKSSGKSKAIESLTLSQITDKQQARSPSGYEELDHIYSAKTDDPLSNVVCLCRGVSASGETAIACI